MQKLLIEDAIHLQTPIIYRLGFDQNYYKLTLILLVKIVLCGKFPWTGFMNYKCFEMRLALDARVGYRGTSLIRTPPPRRTLQ